MSARLPGPVELAGRHVTLRRSDPADGADLYAALDSDEVWRHVGTSRPDTAEAMAALVAEALATRVPWTVRTTSDEVVGWTSFGDIDTDNERLEIGWTAYARQHWATAVNPETKLLLMRHAFEDLGYGRVTFKTDVRNVRSQQAITRLGARREGVLRRHVRRLDGTWRDSVYFSVVVEEWSSVRRGLERRLAGRERTAAVHRYAGMVSWSGSTAGGYTGYSRDHVATAAPAALEVPLSSDPSFRGDAERLNPEQLLLLSAASCQLLWFLSLAAGAGLDVVSYDDACEAVMPEDNLPVRLTEIVLRPVVGVRGTVDVELVRRLAAEAHELCYVANSLTSLIRVEPTVCSV